MQEGIHPAIKINFIRWGDAGIFGADSDVRRKLPDEECLARFDEVWNGRLSVEVEQATEITRDEAEELLEEKLKSFALGGYKYRQFSLAHVPFVVRITMGTVCDQLWALGTHRDNSRLCLYFDTIDDKKRFDRLAKRLGREPRAVALRLCMEFLEREDA